MFNLEKRIRECQARTKALGLKLETLIDPSTAQESFELSHPNGLIIHRSKSISHIATALVVWGLAGIHYGVIRDSEERQ